MKNNPELERGFLILMQKESYETERFSENAVLALESAVHLAGSMGHTYIGTEHYLLGLLHCQPNSASEILLRAGITEQKFSRQMTQTIGRGTPASPGYDSMTPALHRILKDSQVLADKAGMQEISTKWILLAILQDENCSASELLELMHADFHALEQACYHKNLEAVPTEEEFPQLFHYGKLLLPSSGSDPLIGRESETERILQILSRKNKNNPCLIGEPGVGKTAVVQGVAERFARGEVPPQLEGMFVFSLDLGALLAGAKYRGDFEDRIRSCIEEVRNSNKIILFIDELHTIVGAGAAEGAIDAANLLKPQLARGDFRIIGATTPAEYAKTIEKDGALERRFQRVMIHEPSPEETLNILKGLKENYENYHQVFLTDAVLQTCVELSGKYIAEKSFPDKAIDLLDESCARASLKNENFPEVSVEDVASVASMRTGIPLEQMTSAEQEKLLQLQSVLQKKIIGHEKIIAQLCDAVCRAGSGFRDIRRPVGSFLFLGSTGVGKTALVRTLSETLYGTEKALLQIDMSEYMEAHTVSRLLGAPPGYVGFSEESVFYDHLRKRPCSVILFDEIEKAHPDILHILLQILEDGIITDSMNRKISFRNCFIFMTSNSGMHEINRSAGFVVEVSQKRTQAIQNLKKQFPPELLNRIDEILVFESLTKENLIQIARQQLQALTERIQQTGSKLEYDEKVVQFIADCPETALYGARPIRRFVTQEIENPLSRMWLHGEFQNDDRIFLTVEHNQIQLKMTERVQESHAL